MIGLYLIGLTDQVNMSDNLTPFDLMVGLDIEEY